MCVPDNSKPVNKDSESCLCSFHTCAFLQLKQTDIPKRHFTWADGHCVLLGTTQAAVRSEMCSVLVCIVAGSSNTCIGNAVVGILLELCTL